jgi:hypothetical protein
MQKVPKVPTASAGGTVGKQVLIYIQASLRLVVTDGKRSVEWNDHD